MTVNMLSEAHGGPPKELAATNLLDLFRATVLRYPDAPALICSHQSANLYRRNCSSGNVQDNSDCLRWSYREADEKSTHLAAHLYARGVRKGMTLATFLYNNADWYLAMLVVMKLGCLFVPLNPRVLIDPKTTAHMLKTPNTQFILVQDDGLAQSLDRVLEGSGLDIKLKIKAETEMSSSGWLTMNDLMIDNAPSEAQQSIQEIEHLADDPFLVCYTSGTTSLPKACLHISHALLSNLNNMFMHNFEVGRGVVFCNMMPNNHLIGIYNTMTQLISGGTTLYPCPTFASDEILAAINKEGATDIIVVPTMLFALAFEVKTGKIPKPTSLQRATLGGAAVTAELLQQCQDDLGIKKVCGGFGMSEGSPVRGPFVYDPSVLKRGHTVTVGRVIPGSMVRICAPGTQVSVPRGQPGELHQGGPNMMKGYIGRKRSEDWYSDKVGEWFRTGDQAIMEDDGQLIISGRYKEIIIRGGENLSPAVIEAVLNKTQGVEAVIVPAPDEIAGEVPVAVIKSAKNEYSVKALQESVMKTLGSMYVPETILNLKQLGMDDDFPRGLSGKVQKTEVAARVRDFRAKPLSNGNMGMTTAESKALVIGIWTNLLGLPEKELDLGLPVKNFSDSIAIMRFIDSFKKQTGNALSIEDIIEHPTIRDQIKLAEKLPNHMNGTVPPAKVKSLRSGSPNLDELVHLSGREEEAKATRKAVEETIKPFGLTWNDLSTITPGYDHAQMLFKKRRECSWVMRWCQMTDISDIDHVRTAIIGAVRRYPHLHGFLIQEEQYPETGTSLYITVQPTKEWFARLVTEAASVETEDELENFDLFDPDYSHASFPGPLFHADLVRIRQTNKVGFILSLNHSTLDAMAQRLFIEDLDALLANPAANLPYHEDYALWSETTYLLRKSPQAELATNYHVNRLYELFKHKAALFPASRAPEWFFGNPSTGWNPSNTSHKNTVYENPHRKNLNKAVTLERLDRLRLSQIHLPHLLSLREKCPNLTGPAIFKTALAIFNTRKTGHSHALFSSLEANRTSLAFAGPALSSRLDFDLGDCPGPMYTRVIDLMDIRKEEKVLEMMGRVQDEQVMLTRFAGAPMKEIYKRLLDRQSGGGGGGGDGSGSADIMIDVMRRQFVNWVPGLSQIIADRERKQQQQKQKQKQKKEEEDESFQHQGARVLEFSSLCDEGFSWIAGLSGADGSTFHLGTLIDDANITTQESEDWVDQVLEIMRWITDEGNWGRKIGDF